MIQQQKPGRNKTKGAARPIISNSFRDRVQVDLISFHHDPAVDHNGVEMRYILVTKDHCTTFIWLRAIPRKEATIVAAELRLLFHEIGFPLIFHSDNGTEFMASVLESIRKDPFSYYVHGRPRTPSDQGSVERVNRDIQDLISLKIEEYKTVHNKIVTWVDVLPEVTSSINCGVRYGNNNLSSYQHVYGMKYEFPLDIPHSEFSSVKTINDLDGLVNNPQFSEKLKRLGYNLQRAKEQKKTASTAAKKPAEATQDAANPPAEATQDAAKPPAEATQDATKPPAEPAQDAAKPPAEPAPDDLDYNIGDVICKECKDTHTDRFDNIHVAQPAYYQEVIDDTNKWVHICFLRTFAILMAHKCHRDDIVLADCSTPSATNPQVPETIDNDLELQILPSQRPSGDLGLQSKLQDSVTSVVAIAYAHNHYAILEFVLQHKTINVYDGKRYDVNKYWGPHRRDILTRMGSETEIDACWPMHHVTYIGNDVPLQQNDGFSCGPIACMVIWYLFCPNTGLEKWQLLSVPQFRSTVVNMMTTMLKTAYVDLLDGPQHPLHDRRNQNSSDHCADQASTDLSQKGTVMKRKQNDDLREETSRKQRDKMLHSREASVPIVKKGDIVLLSPDKRDRERLHRGSDVVAIVLKVFENTKSIFAITACGIVAKTSKFQSQPMSIPIDKTEQLKSMILFYRMNWIRFVPKYCLDCCTNVR